MELWLEEKRLGTKSLCEAEIQASAATSTLEVLEKIILAERFFFVPPTPNNLEKLNVK